MSRNYYEMRILRDDAIGCMGVLIDKVKADEGETVEEVSVEYLIDEGKYVLIAKVALGTR